MHIHELLGHNSSKITEIFIHVSKRSKFGKDGYHIPKPLGENDRKYREVYLWI